MEELTREKKRSFWGGILAGVFVTGTLLTILFIVLLEKETKLAEQRISEVATSVQGAASSSQSSTSSNTSKETSVKTDGSLISSDFVDKANLIYDNVVKKFYFEEDIDTSKMYENMYKAIIDSLGDKYAEYYTAEELDEMFMSSEGIYYGIGSYVMMDEETGYPILTKIFKDSPAARAGLLDNDIIYAVNGESLFGYKLDDAVALIRGPENTTVDLTVYREGAPDYIEVTVTRGKVESPTVEYEMKEDGIGYLQITEFDEVTTDQFTKAYSSLYEQGMKAMILDLRSNGGGNLDTVLNIGEQMLPKGIITYTEDKQGKRDEYKCRGKNVISIPLVVLTNEYTASASELLTGALHDYGLATVIGTNTYGKGIVQTIYPLSDGSGIKITTSRYYTPNGVCIHGEGIAPDIELEYDSELYATEKIDNQLVYAIDFLKEKLK
ncbi:MAG: S41 family peptidase [Lachnospiraceae bacterium]|nr:S41 family peptidase [Lachnospiraceae bacterium]